MTLSKFSILTIISFVQLVLTSCNHKVRQPDTPIKTNSVINSRQNLTTDDKSFDSLRNTNVIEDKIIDTIFKLLEVKEREKYIEEQTKGKRHLKIWVADTPNLTDKYYLIKVGEDNGISLVTHFNFFVYPDSLRIMYYDTMKDTLIKLDDWRTENGR
jgi:hypothetical protein